MDPVAVAEGPLGETLAAFAEAGPAGAPLTTREVAEAAGCTRRTAYDRLERLAERGAVETKKVGARGRVWWRPPGADRAAAEQAAGGDHPAGDAATGGPGNAAVGADVPCGATDPPHGGCVPVAVLDTADVAVFVLDDEFEVAWANRGVERYFGLDRDEVVGRDKRTVVREAVAPVVADGEEFVETVLSTYDGDHGARTFECRVTGGPGCEERWLEHRSQPIESGRCAGGRVEVYYDVTERREYERELRAERDRFERILETSPNAIGVFAADGSTVTANEEVAQWLGLPTEDAGGYTLGETELLGPSGEVLPFDERPVARVFETGEAVSEAEIRVEQPDAESRWLRVDASPVEDETGTVTHAVVTATDVTRLKEQSRQLARRRDELEHELEEVLGRVDDAFLALDGELRFTYVNDRAEAILERSEEELLGRTVWEAFPDVDERLARDRYETAMETQEPAQFETFNESLDAWLEVTAYPSESGVSVYFHDVTDRKKRERELERFEAIVEAVDDGIYVLDEEYDFVKVNDAYCEMTGYDRDELVGSHCSLVVDEEVSATAAARSEALVDEGGSETIEADVHRADGDTVRAESRFSPLLAEDGEYRGTVGVVRDVSERVERERELERYETIVEAVDDGVCVVDDEGRFTWVNRAYAEMTGYARDELVGEHISLLVDEEVVAAAQERAAAVRAGDSGPETLQADLRTADGGSLPATTSFAVFETADGASRWVGVVRDVSERKRYEETLTALHDSTRELFDAETAAGVGEVVVDAATRIIDLAGVAVYRHDADSDADGGEMVPEAQSLAEGFLGGSLPPLPADGSSVVGSVFVHGEQRWYDDVRSAPNLHDIADDTAMRGALVVPLADRRVLVAGSYDVGGVDDRARRLVDLLAANAAAAYDRVDREQQLRRQRDRLRALDDLNAVVRGINEALVEQSSREEIARVVCERLAASDSYRFAWFGTVDPKRGTIESKVEVGVDDYLPEIPVSMDVEDAPDGPAIRAARTHEVQVVEDALDDAAFEPWREHAREFGFRSVAAVPVVHDGTLYGLVGVYADEPGAFSGEQRAVVGQLRTVVGHAIASIERKRVLMSDEVVEVEFRIRDVFGTLDAEAPAEGTIRFDQAVPAGDDTYLVYGSADEAAVEGVRTLVDRQSHWEELSVLGRERGQVTFEVTVTEPPVISLVAARGGYLEGATVEDGNYHLTLHLPPGGEVHPIIEAVEETYPAAELLTRRQATRTSQSAEPLGRALADSVTDRQRAALEAAFYSGYFEWPRDSTGEDVADSLGVSPPTFHQHVRAAQRKLLEALYSDG